MWNRASEIPERSRVDEKPYDELEGSQGAPVAAADFGSGHDAFDQEETSNSAVGRPILKFALVIVALGVMAGFFWRT